MNLINEILKICYEGTDIGTIELEDFEFSINFGEMKVIDYTEETKDSLANGELLYYSTPQKDVEKQPLTIEKLPKKDPPIVLKIIKDYTKQ